jgi:hypothetical protein
VFTRTGDQLADLLTKGFAEKSKFEGLVKRILATEKIAEIEKT